MSDLNAARETPEDLLWEQLEAAPSGMLGVDGGPRHMQPMVHFADREGRRLWFLTRRDSELYETLRSGARAHFCLISSAQDFHACVDGEIGERYDRARLDAIWRPAVAAWFKDKDDPRLRMLALRLRSAGIWASPDGSPAGVWETIRASVAGEPITGTGVHCELTLA